MKANKWEKFKKEKCFWSENGNIAVIAVEDIEEYIKKILDKELEILSPNSYDTIYHNDGKTGKKYTWKCIKIEDL